MSSSVFYPNGSYNGIQPKVTAFSDSAPEWRRIWDGLNSKALCRNCNEEVWIQYGFGHFEKSYIYSISKCPRCNSSNILIKGLGLVKAVCYAFGRRVNQTQYRMIGYKHCESSGCWELQPGNLAWNDLEFFVIKLTEQQKIQKRVRYVHEKTLLSKLEAYKKVLQNPDKNNLEVVALIEGKLQPKQDVY